MIIQIISVLGVFSLLLILGFALMTMALTIIKVFYSLLTEDLINKSEITESEMDEKQSSNFRGEKPDTPKPEFGIDGSQELEIKPMINTRGVPKYFLAIEYYPNCRGHDEGYAGGIVTCSTFDEVLHYAINNIDDIAIIDIVDSSGSVVGDFHYIFNEHGHICKAIEFKSMVNDLNNYRIEAGK